MKITVRHKEAVSVPINTFKPGQLFKYNDTIWGGYWIFLKEGLQTEYKAWSFKANRIITFYGTEKVIPVNGELIVDE